MLTLRRGCALALLVFTLTWVTLTPAAASVDAVIQGVVDDALMHPLPLSLIHI